MKLSKISVLKATLAVAMSQPQLSRLTTIAEIGAGEPESAIKLLEMIQQRSGSSEAFVSRLLTMFDKIQCFSNLTEIVRKFELENPNINETTESQLENTTSVSITSTQKLEFNRTLVKISDIIPTKHMEILVCISPINQIEREQVPRGNGNRLFDILKQHGCISACDLDLLFEMFSIVGLGKASELLRNYQGHYPVPSAPVLAPPSFPTPRFAPTHARHHISQPGPSQPSVTQYSRPVAESSPPQAVHNITMSPPSLQPRKESCLPPVRYPNPDPGHSQNSQFRSTPKEQHTEARSVHQSYARFPPHQPPPRQPTSLISSPPAPVEASNHSTKYVVNVSSPLPPSQESRSHHALSPLTTSAGGLNTPPPLSEPQSETPACIESSGQHHPSELAGVRNQPASNYKRSLGNQNSGSKNGNERPPPVNPNILSNYEQPIPPTEVASSSPSEPASTVSSENSLPSFESKAQFPLAQQQGLPSQSTAMQPSSTAWKGVSASPHQVAQSSGTSIPDREQHIGATPFIAPYKSQRGTKVVASPQPSVKMSTLSVPELLEKRRSTRSSRPRPAVGSEKGTSPVHTRSKGEASSLKRTRGDSEEQFVTAQEGTEELVRKKLKVEKAPKQHKKQSFASKFLSYIPGIRRKQKTEVNSNEFEDTDT